MRKLHTTLLLLVMVFLTSCSYNELPEGLTTPSVLESTITLNVETRAETYGGIQLDQEYFVTATDLENYVKFRREESKRPDLSVKEVVSYGFDDSQTLFYILNYDEGWEVIAADKRVQPTLAHGENGSFTMNTDNEPMKFWMNMLADVVLHKRQNTNTAISKLSCEKENEFVDFWDETISCDNTLNTRAGETYAYLVETEENTRADIIGTKLDTKWGQGSPWNTYCPYIGDDTSEGRAPAGCVAVAGAQAMYYLRKHFQMQDLSIPSRAFCVGNIDLYTRNFTDFTDTVWEQMATDNNNTNVDSCAFAAIFIAYIGELVGVTYGEDSSGAQTTDLPEKVFEPYGITSSTTNGFDIDIVKQNLKKKLPIVIKGRDAMLFGGGHTWIIDHYKIESREIINYYAVFDSPQTEEYISTLDKTDAQKRVITTTTLSEDLWMNWGWNGHQDGWFATIPDEWWLKDKDDDWFRYKYYIKMIHDFSVN